MSNSTIVDIFELTAKLIDLHDLDDVRAKVYTSAAYNLDRFAGKLENMDFEIGRAHV